MIDRDRLTCIGVVANAHGLKGELKVTPLTASPEFYHTTKEVIVELPGGLKVCQVTASRTVSAGWVLSLEGIRDRSAAESLRGARLLLEEAALKPLEEGEYFQHDLIGCSVETSGGKVLGEVEGLMETGANDVLVVACQSGTVLIPMVAAVVKQVDVKKRLIRIDPLPGMLEPDDEDETY